MTNEDILAAVKSHYQTIEPDTDLHNCIRELVMRAYEEAAKQCEAVVTFSGDHIEYAPIDDSTPCGWCDGLERAAVEIRALKDSLNA